MFRARYLLQWQNTFDDWIMYDIYVFVRSAKKIISKNITKPLRAKRWRIYDVEQDKVLFQVYREINNK